MGELVLKQEAGLNAFVLKCSAEIFANTNQEPGNISNHMVSLFIPSFTENSVNIILY